MNARALGNSLAVSLVTWGHETDRKGKDMGFFSGLFSVLTLFSGGRSSSGSSSRKVYGKGSKRTYATKPKSKNPNSKRSTGNTSRYKRF